MKLFTKLLSYELISGSLYIFIGSMLANFLAFLLNLYLARNLSYADYAIFASLLSIITLAAIPANSLSAIIVKFATSFYAKKENEKLKTLYSLFFKVILAVSVLIIMIFSFFALPLSQFLHLDNILYMVATGFIIVAYYLNAFHTAFLQSLLKFKFMSFLSVVGGVLKLVFGVILVGFGFKAFGGLWALFVMTFGMFLLAYLPILPILRSKYSEVKISLGSQEILSYALPTFVTVLFLTSFTSSDVILIKHFFNPHLAGYYAGLSLMGKVIFYFTMPIPLVMFPLLVKKHTAGQSFVNVFYLSLFLVALPSLAISIFYFLFPQFVIDLFLGGRQYLYIAPFLGIFGLFLTVFSLVNVCVNFFLSVGKTGVAVLVVVAALAQILLISLYHTNFLQVILISLIIMLALLIILVALFVKQYVQISKIKENIAFLISPNL